MQLIPVYDKLILRKAQEAEVSKGGIVLPDSIQKEKHIGVVVSVGHGRLLQSGQIVPLVLQVDDTVVYNKFSGTETELDGEKYIVIREDDVLAVIRGNE
jgi:chaperonin GroES